MNTLSLWKAGLASLGVMGLAACGGGGTSDDRLAGIDGSGAPARGVSAGPITGFGSVLLNGRRFIVDDNTQILIDDNPSTSDLLEVGEFVVVTSEGTDASGNPVATSISQETLLKGSIASLDSGTLQFTSLGQTVQVRANTIVDPTFTAAGAISDFERLEVGDGVEVSGYIASDGTLIATFVGYEDNVSEPRVIGTVSGLNSEALTFSINGLLVDYNAATVYNVPGDMLANNQLVRVRGTLNGDTLEASEVKGAGDDFGDLDEGIEAELKGIITSMASSTQISVNGVAVTIEPDAVFEGGTPGQLAVGVVVEVEGHWTGSSINADEVKFEREENVRIDAQLEAVNATNASLNQGTLTILGLDVTSTSATRYQDESDAKVESFGLDDLQTGDYVELRGYREGNSLVLTEVAREDIDLPLEVSLRGTVTSETPNTTIGVLGVTVNVSGAELRDQADASLTATAFFNAVVVDTSVVEVRGSYSGGTITATHAELE
jgi:hypothetical protein